MRTLVIGDIHGDYAALLDLLELAAVGADDRVIALGDLVDWGPDSPGVVKYFRSRPGAFQSLLGDHEHRHLQRAQGRAQASPSQQLGRLQFAPDEYPTALEYFSHLPLYLELPEALLIHAGLEPGQDIAQQKPEVLLGQLAGARHLQRGRRPWYELWAGKQPVIAGHLVYQRNKQPLIWDNRIFLIDTGCGQGGGLTGLWLPEFKIITAPARI